MELSEKLKILSDAAKYDASCSSSGSIRKNNNGIGNTSISGICHSYSNDGRCISLLKILMTNICIYDCKYCLNRRSNNIKRAIFTPEEVCYLTINFYKRNYIEGLFLSYGVIKNPDYTMELLIKTISLLRNKYNFHGYIHAKAIPNANPNLLKQLGKLVDRLSTNIELPTDTSLKLLAPNKNSNNIYKTMDTIKEEKSKYFAPAGQSTQMIIGATTDSDKTILNKSSNLYKDYKLKRVFYSAYIPVNKDKLLPVINAVPLKREHRLYQADFLMRFYNFKVDDIIGNNSNLDLLIDPKANYALNNMHLFPIEINKASYYDLLKVPGIGPKSAKRIISSRKIFPLEFNDLKKLGVVMKRASYFITCNGKYYLDTNMFKEKIIKKNLILEETSNNTSNYIQLGLFDE